MREISRKTAVSLIFLRFSETIVGEDWLTHNQKDLMAPKASPNGRLESIPGTSNASPSFFSHIRIMELAAFVRLPKHAEADPFTYAYLQLLTGTRNSGELPW